MAAHGLTDFLPSYGFVSVWFRLDVNVHDSAALTHALEEVEAVLPVYCCDVRQFGKAPFGCEKAGTLRGEGFWCAPGFSESQLAIGRACF